ncbi:MAG: hypothetical protein KHY88_00320 [Erysipelotrichaceae bacterium]|nr:hypothetical protein [Erysipelotrichaceae bacterium]
MKLPSYITKLMIIFDKAFINRINELILIPRTNLYFSLNNVESEFDLKCKVLEWCSRDACKSMPYQSDKHNEKYQDDVRKNINNFLKTDFTREDMELIYTRLGNAVNHKLTIKFVQSNYDMNILRSE